MKRKRTAAILTAAFLAVGSAGCAGRETGSVSQASGTSAEQKAETKSDAAAGTVPEEETVNETASGTIAARELCLSGDNGVVLPDPGTILVDQKFDDGSCGHFSIYSNGGSCKLENRRNTLAVDIQRCGKVDYGNQIYYDGFKLEKGAVYTLSYDISSSIERKIVCRIQINGGDYHSYYEKTVQAGTGMTHVEEDFTMQEDSDPAPRLCFNMGLLDMEQEPGNHTVQLDNVKLVVKDISGATAGAGLPEYPDAVTNQVGFRPSDTKHVIVRNAGSGGTFRLINDRSGETVLEGQLGAEQYDEAVREKVRIGDFSSFGTRGIYHIRVNTESCEQDTPSFAIGNHVYDRIYKDTLRMFSLHRCGTEVTAQNEEFSHVRCHGRKALLYGTDKVIDVSGGWHDAADYGRYVVSGAKAVADLLWAYEDCGALGDDTGIPESNNRIPDILDEVRYELDWMLKMQDPVTGGVHHKVSCKVHPDNIGPEEETEQLVVAPVSTTATGDFAAVMAKASVIYKKSDPVFSKKALAAAKKAFAFIKDKEDTTGYKNPGDIVTDEYADKETSDEILWAAAELYLAGEEDCADVIRKRWDPERTDIGLGWADVAGYACWDLLKADGGKLKDVTAAMKEKLLRRADELVEKTVSSAYGCSLGSDFFRWSNMTAANNGMLLEIAARVSGREKYRAAAHEQVGYLLGENPLGCCFVTGWGAISPLNPHHRPSQKSGRTMKGMLVGGPDKNLEDSYAKAVLAGQPDGMCYVDSAQSYSTNDVAIYLNSPLVYLLAVR